MAKKINLNTRSELSKSSKEIAKKELERMPLGKWN